MTFLAELPTLEWVENYSTTHLSAAAERWKATAKTWEDFFGGLASAILKPGGSEWRGSGASAAQDNVSDARDIARGAANQLRAAEENATFGAGQLDGLHWKTMGFIRDAGDDDFRVDSDLSVTDIRTYPSDSSSGVREQEARKALAENYAEDIQAHAGQLLGLDREYGRKLLTATEGLEEITMPSLGGVIPTTDGHHGHVQQVDNKNRSEPEADRRHNQIDAFKHVFDREPVSRADWDTAAALDPHSYDPKNGGVPPNIAVGTITPHPGQDVVRTNLFIPGQGVLDPQLTSLPHTDLGDNRGFSPTVGPEASRVSVLIDYENGIIVARQNPSVDATTGAIRAGNPTVSAVQRSDGGILLRYNAADPFSPGGEGLAKGIPFSVNGELAITPTPNGPVVGGNVTNYPAIEVYHDGASGPSQVLAQQWPLFSDGSTGPGVGLWWHRPIGDASLVYGFNDLYPPMPGAPPPGMASPHSGPTAVPAAPPLIATPPGLSQLGPVSAPPPVQLHDPVVMLPPLPR